MHPSDLTVGSTVMALDGASATDLTLGALFTPEGSEEILGLIGRSVHDVDDGATIAVQTPAGASKVGTLHSLESLTGSTSALDRLFAIVRFHPEVQTALRVRAQRARVTNDIQRNTFRRGPMRIRKLGGRTIKRNQVMKGASAAGFLMGSVLHPVVEVRGHNVTFDKASLAKGRGGRDFAKPGDGGSPVISAAGALLGFIIGRSDTRALVLPAEDVARTLGAQFLTTPPEISGPSVRARDPHPLITSDN